MKTPEFVYGNIAPVFTAFKDDLSLDDDGQRHMFDFLLQSGAITSYFVRSGLGQMYTFEMDDVKQLARTACEHMDGKAPVLVGCSGIWGRNRGKRPIPAVFVAQAVTLSRFAQDVGAAGVVHTVPEAIHPRREETASDVVKKYVETVAEAVSIPILMYQPPGTAEAYRLTPALVAELAAVPNVVGAKVSTTDGYYLYSLIRAAQGKDFAFVAGAETVYYAALYAGARAVIGQGATMYPQILKALQERFLNGDHAGALEAQDSANRLVTTCRNPVGFFKRYVSERGFRLGRAFRSTETDPGPTPLSDQEYSAFKVIFEEELAKYAPDAVS